MIVWMAWTAVFSALAAGWALALERAAAFIGARRRFIWIAALLSIVTVPALFATRRAHVAPRVVRTSPAALKIDRLVVIAAVPSPVTRAVRQAAIVHASADTWAGRAWAVLSLLVAGAFLRAMLTLRSERKGWRDTTLLGTRVLVADTAGPAVAGFVRPRVVIPEWVFSADPRAQHFILKHETEHVRARDPLLLAAAGAILVVVPWNPAAWWIVRRLRLAMEVDCDARVLRGVRGVRDARDYGTTLLTVGERTSSALILSASLAGPRSLLERRLTAMTMPKRRHPRLAAAPLVGAALIAMTAAATVPRPDSLGTIAHARGPQDYPTRDSIAAMVATHLPQVAKGSDTSNYVVIVLDANNNFVRALAGSGSAMIRVDGDKRTADERRRQTAERTGIPARAPGQGGRSGAGGGRGGGTTVPVRIDERFEGVNVRALPRESYASGVFRGGVGTDPATGERRTAAPLNAAPGMTTFGDNGASGIEGIPAADLTSLDIFRFAAGELTSRMVEVLVVTTNTIGPVK